MENHTKLPKQNTMNTQVMDPDFLPIYSEFYGILPIQVPTKTYTQTSAEELFWRTFDQIDAAYFPRYVRMFDEKAIELSQSLTIPQRAENLNLHKFKSLSALFMRWHAIKLNPALAANYTPTGNHCQVMRTNFAQIDRMKRGQPQQ